MNLNERLSVVIPTKNRPFALTQLYTQLLLQSRRPDEVVIVDQSDAEIGRQAVEAAQLSIPPPDRPRLRYIHDPSISGAAGARNAGFHHTSGDFIAFIDDDIHLAPKALSLVAEALSHHPALLAASGIVTNPRAPAWYARLATAIFFLGPFHDERQRIYRYWHCYSDGEIVPTRKLYGGFMVWRRSAFYSIAGFDPMYKGSSVGEDIEISQRLLRHDRETRLAFIGGAWVRNTLGGTWRLRDRLEETLIVSSHYLFTKNLPNTITNRFFFAWLNVGIVLVACVASARRRSLAPIRSLIHGFCVVKSEYAGCEFLVPKHHGNAASRLAEPLARPNAEN